MRELEIERRRSPAFSLSLDQTLHASDEILELLPVATCICDLDGRILQYNRRAVELSLDEVCDGPPGPEVSVRIDVCDLDGRASVTAVRERDGRAGTHD